MKKLINAPIFVVKEMMEGLALMHPGLVLLGDETVLARADAAPYKASGKVALVAGGGAGHEPAHAGYVGPGMLTAAVSGDVFTSPSADAIVQTLRAVTGPQGALLIIKNYTGDRLHFGLAAETLRAEGIPVETVVVADDVALAAAGDTAGRRGLAGTVFVHKIAGAAAEAGLPLAEVKREAAAAAAALGTIGVALTPCTVPGAERPGFDLGVDELELGLGIHGEPGVARGKLEPVDAVVDDMIGRIVADLGLGKGARVALLANNLGGTPAMEMALVCRRALARLADAGLVVERAYSGPFLTAIEMAGCSLTVMQLDDRRLVRLDAATAAPAWPPAGVGRVAKVPGRLGVEAVMRRQSVPSSPTPLSHSVPSSPAPRSGALGIPEPRTPLAQVLVATCRAWRAAAVKLNELDRVVGDGDLGLSLERGAAALEQGMAAFDWSHPGAVLQAAGTTVRRAMAGTTGALYGIMLLRAGTTLGREKSPSATDWEQAWHAALAAAQETGGAKPGDRTMLDAMAPALAVFASTLKAGRSVTDGLAQALAAARDGAARTAEMRPRRGRSSYLGERALGHVDPGAQAVVIWLEAVLAGLG
jgi:dihydroxyacetone kinase